MVVPPPESSEMTNNTNLGIRVSLPDGFRFDIPINDEIGPELPLQVEPGTRIDIFHANEVAPTEEKVGNDLILNINGTEIKLLSFNITGSCENLLFFHPNTLAEADELLLTSQGRFFSTSTHSGLTQNLNFPELEFDLVGFDQIPSLSDLPEPILIDTFTPGDESSIPQFGDSDSTEPGAPPVFLPPEPGVMMPPPDIIPTINIDFDLLVPEDIGDAVLRVSLSQPNEGTVSVDIFTLDGTAADGEDYVGIPSPMTIDFLPGTLFIDVPIIINDDQRIEPDETFTLNLANPINGIIGIDQRTVTITDNDIMPDPELSIDDPFMDEGGDMIFTARLGAPQGQPVTFIAQTMELDAIAGADFIGLPPTPFAFEPGQTEVQIIIPINSDPLPEPDQTFAVMISEAVGAVIVKDTGIGTILDSTPQQLPGFIQDGSSGGFLASGQDLNGDGFDDALITAIRANTVFAIFSSMDGFPQPFDELSLFAANGGDGTEGSVFFSNNPSSYIGLTSSIADINGDGFFDVILGQDNDGVLSNAFIVFGNEGGFGFPELEVENLLAVNGGDGSLGTAIIGQNGQDFFGFTTNAGGDVNGDGIDDMIFGTRVSQTTGGAFVLFGSPAFGAEFDLGSLRVAAGGDGSNGFFIAGIDPNGYAGTSVSIAGDINGDGFDDLLISAPDAGLTGQVYVLFGDAAGFGGEFNLANLLPANGGDGSLGFIIEGVAPGEGFGNAVSRAGDVNGDGFEDIIIGAPYGTRGTNIETGEAYVFFGGPAIAPVVNAADLLMANGGDGTQGVVLLTSGSYQSTGYSVGAAGDVNGDGIDDIVIGRPGDQMQTGAANVVFGQTTGFNPEIDLTALPPGSGLTFVGQNPGESFGAAVAGAGDVDGDGLGDLAFGAPFASRNGTIEGGETVIIFGQDSNNIITARGGQGDDMLFGTPGDDIIVGGQGNDFLFGSGGNDVIYGGQGDDQLFLADGLFQRLDGGTGNDSLILEGAGITLNLDNLPQPPIESIENLDIGGTGANTLNLGGPTLFDLGLTQVNIFGDADDNVNIFNANLVSQGVMGGMEIFTTIDMTFTLAIDEAINTGFP